MDEARRFLRFVSPGLTFLVLTSFYWTLWPGPADLLPTLKDQGIGGALALLVGSGGLGYLFGLLSNFTMWHMAPWKRWPFWGHRSRLIHQAIQADLLQIVDSRDPERILSKDTLRDAQDLRLTPAASWVVILSVWHSFLDEGAIKSGDPRIKSLNDFAHAAGALFYATVCAALAWLLLVMRSARWGSRLLLDLVFDPAPWRDFAPVIVCILVVAFGVCAMAWLNWRRVVELAEGTANTLLFSFLRQRHESTRSAHRLWLDFDAVIGLKHKAIVASEEAWRSAANKLDASAENAALGRERINEKTGTSDGAVTAREPTHGPATPTGSTCSDGTHPDDGTTKANDRTLHEWLRLHPTVGQGSAPTVSASRLLDLSLTCAKCQTLADPIVGTVDRYRCRACGGQFAGAPHGL